MSVQMKIVFAMKWKLIFPLITLCLMANGPKAEGNVYVSNLGNLWLGGGIGDIHGLFPGGTPYGNDTARFSTGAGSFSVNSITFEFYRDSSYPAGVAAPQWITIQLFHGDSLLGNFGNPVVDPRPTQWPGYTRFIDFSPLQPITLDPFTQYSIVAGMPTDSPVWAALLFTKSSAYTTRGGIMGETTTGNPYALGEYIKMAVDASAVPEPDTAALLLGGFLVLIGARSAWRKSLAARVNRMSCSNPKCQ